MVAAVAPAFVAATPDSTAGALWRHVAAVQEPIPVPHGPSVVDAIGATSPLPDPIVPVVQWIFQKPPWLMSAGLVLAALLGVVVAALLWRRRRDLARWLVTRSRTVTLTLAGVVVVAMLGAAVAGWQTYQFAMHDNRLCQGCHIFVPSGQAAVRPDTGTYLLVNAVEGPHSKLSCHACHPFDAKAQTLEFIAWITARPTEVPPHGKVPREICERCHVQGTARETWQRIASTAGHRVHLASDSLYGTVECLSCHALNAHRFAPTDSTCANQPGCHRLEDVTIQLGRMAGQTNLHCVGCHQFTADVPALATRDSAAGALRPGERACAACHAMRARLIEIGFDAARDPHAGQCGMCHNPHTNVRPSDALTSCASAACHGTWRDVPFHVGRAHQRVARRCELCHQPHAARVDASDCTGCHQAIRARRAAAPPGLGAPPRPPVPFDTIQGLQQSVRWPRPWAPRGKGDAPPDEAPPAARSRWSEASDSFSHARHRRLTCVTCHDVTSPTHTLTFEPPRGCQICHHAAPDKRDCGTCHAADTVRALRTDATVTVRVAATGSAPRARQVPFAHATHRAVRCQGCHVAPVSLAPPVEVRTCVGCHEQHHTARTTDCATCHRSESTWDAHNRASHVACTACHQATTVAALGATRALCLACHPPAADHYAPRPCTECHLLASPDAYRSALMGAAQR